MGAPTIAHNRIAGPIKKGTYLRGLRQFTSDRVPPVRKVGQNGLRKQLDAVATVEGTARSLVDAVTAVEARDLQRADLVRIEPFLKSRV
jgi:hypothetical protein